MDTVSYGMPPEGYETVTLPVELVEQLDDIAESRRKAISYLMGLEAGDETAAGVSTIADAVVARLDQENNGSENVAEQLDRIERGVKEATNAAQSAEKSVEELQ